MYDTCTIIVCRMQSQISCGVGLRDSHQGLTPDGAGGGWSGTGPPAAAAPGGSTAHVAPCPALCLWHQGTTPVCEA